ncbi:ribonuclease HI [Jiella pacifica]|uniref:Ribonuclease H n=1 Tax=Jiella pacifica TaxID=2696469 RepID=A0A6N9SY05_9HYPH|nr:ribonuclease HI [Jiella pacifica]NDW03954.1 ribonuclease HI [Jiella pacifica]
MQHDQCGHEYVVVHTDGACVGNPGPGGWALVIREVGQDGEASAPRTIVGGASETTSNQMEMAAAVEALKAVSVKSIEIVSDSQYLVKGMTEWLSGWKRRGWKTSDGKPVANRERWLELEALSHGRNIEWTWVRGHSGIRWNVAADKLAQEEARRQQFASLFAA